MSTAGVMSAPRLRRRPGPALWRPPIPVTATLLSAVTHVLLAAGALVAATVWSTSQPKTYIVNLVPTVAAAGSPRGRVEASPRPQPPVPRPALPEREPPPPPERAPARPPELPSRSAALPPRSTATSVPDRALPSRPPVALRPSERDLPPVASTAPRVPPSAAAKPAPVPAPAPPPPPAPLGRASGSAQGSGPVDLKVTDFPFAYYLRQVQSKITERWQGRALQGRQPVAVFEIGRDGQVGRLRIETSSGNSYYDQVALRAITEAAPFPPLPDEFPGQVLRVHLGFNFAPQG